MPARFSPSNCARLVLKIGSALLVGADGSIRREWLTSVSEDILSARKGGQQVVIISSGAIALGARRLGLAKGGRATLEDAQAAAAVGQIALSQAWSELLGAVGLTAAQMLLTLDDLEDRRRYLNAASTLDRLLTLGTVPVINENDSVATAEIRFGDNDRLAARVAQAARAQGVVLLSDVDGLYTANPNQNPDAQRVDEVHRIDGRIRAMADGSTGSGMGSGGMTSKIEAARIAQAAGAHLAIASGTLHHPLSQFLAGAGGTVFVATPKRGGRKTWLSGRLTVRGAITVDAGAVAALQRGASLLAAGTLKVDGGFRRGDVVEIVGPDGALARGLAEYNAADAARIAGRRSADHGAILGYAPRTTLVHRDQMALL